MQTNQSTLESKHWVEINGIVNNRLFQIAASFKGSYKINKARIEEFKQLIKSNGATYTGFSYLGYMTEQEFYSDEVPP